MITAAEIIARVIPALHADVAANLQHWNEAELTGYIVRELERLAADNQLFAAHSAVGTVNGQQAYSYPNRHVRTVFAAYDGTALRQASAAELAALDDGWETATGAVERIIADFEGLDRFALYRIPTATGKTVTIIHYQVPVAPSILGDYLVWAVLAEARRKESDGQMPEVVEHAEERLKLMRAVFAEYWG